MNKLLDIILDEQKFPCEGMTKEERNYYLNIIRNCKDINDSEYKVDGRSKCDILELHLKRNENQVKINGSLSIGLENKKEYRSVDGYIFLSENNILVDMHIIRLSKDGAFMEYTTLDEFKIVEDKLIRNSSYNFDDKEIVTEINN